MFSLKVILQFFGLIFDTPFFFVFFVYFMSSLFVIVPVLFLFVVCVLPSKRKFLFTALVDKH